MQKKSLQCYSCNSLVSNLSPAEMKKLNGLNFRCECCGHENKLADGKLIKGTNGNDPYVNTLSFENALAFRRF